MSKKVKVFEVQGVFVWEVHIAGGLFASGEATTYEEAREQAEKTS